MIRAGKTSLEAEMAPSFQRLGLDRHALESTVAKLFNLGERISNRRDRRPEPASPGRHRSFTQAHGTPHLTPRHVAV